MIVSLVVRKHRYGPGTYGINIEEITREVDAQCATRGWKRTRKPELAFNNPTLTMALVNVRVKEMPSGTPD